MKPLRLEVKGFTAFRDTAVVDFEDRRLFVITGPTGAGKSSLLDAITWVLYGQVPRVGASTRQLISHGANAMAVRFDFSTRGRRYRVSRRAPGNTATRLERETESGEWEPLADRARDVTELVTKILGLDYQTFIRTVLLPQDAFDSFLQGDQRERREIMSRLLGLGVYADARGIAARRAGQARTRAETLSTQLQRIDVATPEAIAALEGERATLAERSAALGERRERLAALAEFARADRDAAKAAVVATQQATAAAEALRRAEHELSATATRIDQGTAERAAKHAAREALGYDAVAHRALERAVALIALREQSEREVARERAGVDAAERALAERRVVATRAERAHVAAAQAAERTARARDKSATALASAAGRALRAAARLDAEAAAADDERREAEQQEAERVERATQLAAICQSYEELREDLRRAREAVAIAQSEVKTTQAGSAGAAKARNHAETTLTGRRATLESLKVKHAAARLQRAVRVGDRCPVCGETVRTLPDEPAPNLDAAAAAVRDAELVLKEARAAAERQAAARAAAGARAEEASRWLRDLEERRAALDARLGFAAEDGLQAAMDGAAVAAAEARARAAAARAVAEQRRGAAGALRLALARLPQDVPAAGEERGDDASPDGLIAAIEAYLAAQATAASASADVREAERATTAAVRECGRAEEAQRRAADALRAAEARRAEHAPAAPDDGHADPAALRAALAAAEDAAARARVLDGAVAALDAALAVAEAQRELRAAERARAAGEVAAAAAASAAGAAAATEARDAFADAWRSVVGEDEPGIEPLRAIMLMHEGEEREARERLGALGERLTHMRAAAVESVRMRDEIRGYEQTAALAGTLEQELRGNKFIAFVQQEAMQLLAADASGRLGQFTSGRYELIAEDDEFMVVDRLNGDERRSVKTLSGGETFLASLALALSLSEHLPQLSGTGGAVSLESLFLDEGFGSLDAESLDLAVQGLETLAGGNRMIGVISHVEELAERLPDRIEVVKAGQSSTIRAR